MTRSSAVGCVVAVALGACPTIASANRSVRRCRAVFPRYELPVHTAHVSCRVAHAVDRYAMTHEWVVPFRVDRHRWRGTIYSRAHGHTYFRFRSGARIVWITHRGEVS